MTEDSTNERDVAATPSDAAKELSKLGAAKGGKARAKSLTPEERSVIARKAVEARWKKSGHDPLPQATHVGELKLGNRVLECAVLDDKTRVLSQAQFLEALGRHRKANVRKQGGEERVPAILQGKSIKPFISKELLEKSRPIRFRTPQGSRASGYRAELLPEVCDVYLRAREANALPRNQEHVAKQAEILVRALSTVGIIALVDEATGFQDDRARDALAKILEAFVAKELRKWVKTFPAEFYKELFRLRGLPYTGRVQRPSYIGHLTNDLVYARLAPGVLKELRAKNPVTENGHRKNLHHQWLTADVGHPRLLQHLASVITLMRVCDKWDDFKNMIDRALPRQVELPLFDGLDSVEPLSDTEPPDDGQSTPALFS